MARAKWQASKPAIDAILGARHGDPFAVLGLHEVGGAFVVRALVPHAEKVEAVSPDGKLIAALERRHSDGFFEGAAPGAKARFTYRLRAANAQGSWTFDDPYAFAPVLGDKDDYLLVEGTHRRLFEKLGAHAMTRGHAFRRLGAQRRARLHRRRVQRLGRPPPRHAQTHRQRRVGDFRPGRWAGHAI
jgi:1,4-alpha-glucan branching enzyme